ncbi:MAG: hypothetical protein ACYDBH_01080 [Acidobacteriaceae bacterium]
MPNFPNSPTPWGNATSLNISAATVVKATPGVAVLAQIVTAGTTAGSVNDTTTTGAATTANQVATLPNAVGPVVIGMPCASGIVVVPGSGQVLALSFV